MRAGGAHRPRRCLTPLTVVTVAAAVFALLLIGARVQWAPQAILIVGVVTCVAFLAVTRHWRPAVFVATVMFGELGAFLAAGRSAGSGAGGGVVGWKIN